MNQEIMKLQIQKRKIELKLTYQNLSKNQRIELCNLICIINGQLALYNTQLKHLSSK